MSRENDDVELASIGVLRDAHLKFDFPLACMLNLHA